MHPESCQKFRSPEKTNPYPNSPTKKKKALLKIMIALSFSHFGYLFVSLKDIQKLGGGFKKMFLIFTPGERESNLTNAHMFQMGW